MDEKMKRRDLLIIDINGLTKNRKTKQKKQISQYASIGRRNRKGK